jgi:lysophospholipase L1-like esterase
VNNLSQHNGLQVQGLLDELADGSERAVALSDADVIIVGIAHNDTPWNVDDDACDGAGGDNPDWSKYTAACIAAEVERYTPRYNAVFERIAALRAGKPTVLRTINRYNDWNGWPGHELSPEGVAATAAVIAAWNDMICGAAEANGVACADISTAFNGKDGTEPAGELLAGDYTHPSDKGNEVIAGVLTKLGFEPLAP